MVEKHPRHTLKMFEMHLPQKPDIVYRPLTGRFRKENYGISHASSGIGSMGAKLMYGDKRVQADCGDCAFTGTDRLLRHLSGCLRTSLPLTPLQRFIWMVVRLYAGLPSGRGARMAWRSWPPPYGSNHAIHTAHVSRPLS